MTATACASATIRTAGQTTDRKLTALWVSRENAARRSTSVYGADIFGPSAWRHGGAAKGRTVINIPDAVIAEGDCCDFCNGRVVIPAKRAG